MKYKCIYSYSNSSFTVGKIYETIPDDGRFQDDEPTNKHGLLIDNSGRVRRSAYFYGEMYKFMPAFEVYLEQIELL